MEKQKCTHCGSNCTKKNGCTHYGKQNHLCHDCGRQFVEGGQDWFISDEKKEIVRNLLKERISLEGISRACGVSIAWLYNFIDEEYEQSPDDLNVVITPIKEEEYLAARFDEEIERLQKKKPDKSKQYTEVEDLIGSPVYDEFEQTLYLPDNEYVATSLFEGIEDDLLLTDLYEKERSARVIAFGIQLDEMWSFVGEKSNKKWIWLAINPLNRQIVGFHIGGRGQQDAQAFMDTIPDYFKEHACFFTDYWAAYACVIDPERHFSVGKDSGLTAYIERFNNTLRQRASRLVRKGLSFSKSINRHVKAIKYFICHYNLEHVALQI